MTNPFEPPVELPSEKGVFADHATLVKRRFLFRVIQYQHPFTGTLVYSGWWFRQKIEINGSVVWWKVSWLNIDRDVSFTIPVEVLSGKQVNEDGPQLNHSGPSQPIRGRIEIQFTRGLQIRRFRLWLDNTIVYDEID